jgi:hypothetical protein
MQEYWRFRHGGGAIVVLGTIASAMLGAWPRWRPSLFIGGDVGGGKSYLLDTARAMCPLHYYTTDTTKAELENNLAGRAMPSFVDHQHVAAMRNRRAVRARPCARLADDNVRAEHRLFSAFLDQPSAGSQGRPADNDTAQLAINLASGTARKTYL